MNALVADVDASGTSPGKAVLETLLARYAPCVILIDELVAYVRQFEESSLLSGGSFDSNLSFVKALTEALKAEPTAVLLASLSHYFGRIQALWKPVGTAACECPDANHPSRSGYSNPAAGQKTACLATNLSLSLRGRFSGTRNPD